MIVLIPKMAEHEGYSGNLIKVEISDLCPICNQLRSKEPFAALSYDGSRRLDVDCWVNPCGHTDTYASIRQGIVDGVNKIVPWDTPTTRETIEKMENSKLHE